MITWVFEENSFIPTAKLKNEQKFSILVDHLGTPTSMCNEAGESVWERSLDSCGRLKYGDHSSCEHFMYQGQYYDKEIELAYNRFRYYDPNDGRYISVDPIGLESGEFGLYNYIGDPNGWLDVFGLQKSYDKVDLKNKKKNKKLLEDLDDGKFRMAPYGNDATRGAILPRSRNGKKIKYTEDDVMPLSDNSGRGVKRIVKGDDGRVYYTNGHYQSFTRIR